MATASVTVTVHTEPYITAMTDLMGKLKANYAQTEFVTLYGNKLCGQTATASSPFGSQAWQLPNPAFRRQLGGTAVYVAHADQPDASKRQGWGIHAQSN